MQIRMVSSADTLFQRRARNLQNPPGVQLLPRCALSGSRFKPPAFYNPNYAIEKLKSYTADIISQLREKPLLPPA
jgi:hypothetical protein